MQNQTTYAPAHAFECSVSFSQACRPSSIPPWFPWHARFDRSRDSERPAPSPLLEVPEFGKSGTIRKPSNLLKGLPSVFSPEPKETFEVKGLDDANTTAEQFICALAALVWEIRKSHKGKKTVNLNNGSIIVKFNANGEYEYEKGYSTILFNDCSYNEWQGITSAKQTLDNGYILSGGCQYDPILIKTDSNGQLEWTKSIDNNSIESIATNIYQTNDEGYVFISRHGLRSTITKFDSVGNILGNLKLWNSANDGDNGIYEIYGVELLALTMNLTNDGGYVIGGKTISTNGENIEPSVFLMKIDNIIASII